MAAAGARGRRRRRRPELDDLYDAFAHAAPSAPTLPLLDAGRGASPTSSDVRGRGRSSVLDASRPRRPSGCSSDGFVYGMRRPARAPARRDDARDAPAHATTPYPLGRRPTAAAGRRGLAGEVRGRRRAVRDGHRRRAVGLRQRAAGARGRARAVLDRRRAGHERARSPSSSTPAATTTPQLWHPAGWAWRQRAALEHPAFWRREGGGLGAAPLRPLRAAAAGRAGAARVLVRGRRLRALGRQAPADRGRVGAARGPGGSGATRGATAPGERANLAQRRFGPAAVGSYPDGASAYGARAAARRRLGVDGARLPAYPGFEAFPYREYSEVFFGSEYKVLRGGSWATAPGRGAHDLPQLGLPDPAPDLRRLPVRPRRRDGA